MPVGICGSVTIVYTNVATQPHLAAADDPAPHVRWQFRQKTSVAISPQTQPRQAIHTKGVPTWQPSLTSCAEHGKPAAQAVPTWQPSLTSCANMASQPHKLCQHGKPAAQAVPTRQASLTTLLLTIQSRRSGGDSATFKSVTSQPHTLCQHCNPASPRCYMPVGHCHMPYITRCTQI
jgi:antitoxin (DNA-binding transcriptional repressor) of toxin-antitoxin stability system